MWLVRAYNSLENYTFVVGPTSDAAQNKLPWRLAIVAMGYLPSEMMRHGREGRWAELTGRIKLDGAWVGKILILKGDYRTSSLPSCGIAWFGDDGDREEIFQKKLPSSALSAHSEPRIENDGISVHRHICEWCTVKMTHTWIIL